MAFALSENFVVSTATQAMLLAWVAALPHPPRELRLVHGDAAAKAALAGLLRQRYPATEVLIPA